MSYTRGWYIEHPRGSPTREAALELLHEFQKLLSARIVNTRPRLPGNEDVRPPQEYDGDKIVSDLQYAVDFIANCVEPLPIKHRWRI